MDIRTVICALGLSLVAALAARTCSDASIEIGALGPVAESEEPCDKNPGEGEGHSKSQQYPLECFAFGTKPNDLGRLARGPVLRKARLPWQVRHPATLLRPVRLSDARLARVVAQSRCVTTSMEVIAPPIVAHGPPLSA